MRRCGTCIPFCWRKAVVEAQYGTYERTTENKHTKELSEWRIRTFRGSSCSKECCRKTNELHRTVGKSKRDSDQLDNSAKVQQIHSDSPTLNQDVVLTSQPMSVTLLVTHPEISALNLYATEWKYWIGLENFGPELCEIKSKSCWCKDSPCPNMLYIFSTLLTCHWESPFPSNENALWTVRQKSNKPKLEIEQLLHDKKQERSNTLTFSPMDLHILDRSLAVAGKYPQLVRSPLKDTWQQDDSSE